MIRAAEGTDRAAPEFIARRLLAAHVVEELQDVAALNPKSALETLGIIVQEDKSLAPSQDCPIPASYDALSRPPIIRLNSSSNPRRDSFSLLHELGHHLLALDEEWSFDIAPTAGHSAAARLEEAIANKVASLVLIPDDVVDRFPMSTERTLSAVAQSIYAATFASRAAVVQRVMDRSVGDLVLAVTDHQGRISFARSSGGLFAPAAGTIQPSFASRILAAKPDGYSGPTFGSIAYRSGSSMNDVLIDASISDGFAFVAAVWANTLSQGFDDQEEFECPWCHTTRPASWHFLTCRNCGEPRCPDCSKCGCSSPDPICEVCSTALPAALVANGSTICELCG